MQINISIIVSGQRRETACLIGRQVGRQVGLNAMSEFSIAACAGRDNSGGATETYRKNRAKLENIHENL